MVLKKKLSTTLFSFIISIAAFNSIQANEINLQKDADLPFASNDYAAQVQEMIRLVREAAHQEILPRWQNVTIENKSQKHSFKDLVTEADKQASLYILKRIRPTIPGSYSEEHKHADRFDHDIVWQIDPVDGTQEFCEGYENGYTTLAALLKRQDDGTYASIAGIIYLPATDTLWYTNDSTTVVFMRNSNELPLPTYQRNELRIYQRAVDHLKGINDFAEYLGNQLNLPTHIVESGGAGAAVADLLEGKINLLIFNNDSTKDWDCGMAAPLVKALGGFICDLDGNDLTFNRHDEPGLSEPYNLRGFIMSIVFKKEEIMPHTKHLVFDHRLVMPKK